MTARSKPGGRAGPPPQELAGMACPRCGAGLQPNIAERLFVECSHCGVRSRIPEALTARARAHGRRVHAARSRILARSGSASMETELALFGVGGVALLFVALALHELVTGSSRGEERSLLLLLVASGAVLAGCAVALKHVRRPAKGGRPVARHARCGRCGAPLVVEVRGGTATCRACASVALVSDDLQNCLARELERGAHRAEVQSAQRVLSFISSEIAHHGDGEGPSWLRGAPSALERGLNDFAIRRGMEFIRARATPALNWVLSYWPGPLPWNMVRIASQRFTILGQLDGVPLLLVAFAPGGVPHAHLRVPYEPCAGVYLLVAAPKERDADVGGAEEHALGFMGFSVRISWSGACLSHADSNAIAADPGRLERAMHLAVAIARR